jgi:hypothetical protein
MTGHNFSELVAKMPRKRQARIARIARTLRQDLAQLRGARAPSQALGEILHVEQPAVAKLEKRNKKVAKLGG